MLRRLSLTFWMMLLATVAAFAQTAVGGWSDHFSYRRVHQVAISPSCVYAAAPLGLFGYDLDEGVVGRLNKTSRLNDVGISTIAYDEETNCLVVAYNNANIDMLVDGRVYNLSDIKRNSIAADKSIHSIRFYNRCAYLACGFGIVVVDIDRREIKSTYYIGDQGTYLPVYDVVFAGSHIVAATESGLRMADKDSPFLDLITNWTSDSTSLLADQPVEDLEVVGGRLLALSDSTLYCEQSSGVFVPWLTGDIRSFHFCNEAIVVSSYQSVRIYDTLFALRHEVREFEDMAMQALDAWLSADGSLWVGHDWYGLVHLTPPYGDSASLLMPSGPNNDNLFRLVTFDQSLYLCPGGHSSTYEGSYLAPYLARYYDGRWTTLAGDSYLRSQLRDILSVTVNPRNPRQLMAACWGVGVAKIEDDLVVDLFTDTNSDGALVRFHSDDYNALFTGSVAFDAKENLWMSNSLVDQGVVLRSKEGEWRNFDISSMFADRYNDIDNILWDSVNDNVWLYGRPNRFFVVNADGQMAYVDPNHGSKMETSSVHCLVQDHEGDLWVGTNKGIKRIYDGYRVFENGGEGELSPVNCSNIIIQEDGFSEYLMAYESITCIAVDGANRKWVGTSTGGLFLLSATGSEQLLHFSAENSPLASNKIISLAIHPWTGEVFIATDQGLQSYRGTATYADYLPQDDIHAFPNPVRPGYEGPIAIKGFTRNALVHITDVAGHTVFSTRANGGQAIWQGRTNEGVPVGSGVYFVFASDEAGRNRCVTKVLIVR